MIRRTFLTKCTTIYRDSTDNFGLNPILMLNHGLEESRGLVYFDVDKIQEMVDEGYDRDKIKHTLVMHNCGSINSRNFNKKISSHDKNGEKIRATSFDIIALKLPKEWDRGIGFDFSDDLWVTGRSAVSTQGCNWYQAKTGLGWDFEGVYSHTPVDLYAEDQEKGPLDDFDDIISPHGLYSEEEEIPTNMTSIEEEYAKWLKGEESLIVAGCHFDYGNEALKLDLTDYINGIIDKKVRNYGLMLCFAPVDDPQDRRMTKYVGFFTDKTNTFFEPYVETQYDDAIKDSRGRFVLGKDNRLYLYHNVNGIPTDLDNMPICTIDGVSYEVMRQRRGVYYATVNIKRGTYENEQIIYDVWSNIVCDEVEYDDIEQEVIVVSENQFRAPVTGLNSSSDKYITLSGINTSEKLNQGEIRVVEVWIKKYYDKTLLAPSGNLYYRLYVKDGLKEINVIEKDFIEILPETNYFVVDTSELLPNKYFVDIFMDGRWYKDQVHFEIVNNSTEQRY